MEAIRLQPYFIWNGRDSRVMGVIVQSYPPIIRPPERVIQQTIPGRAGTLTITEGPDVYDSYIKQFVIGLRPGADAQAVSAWLRGAGQMVFGNEPQFAYTGRILAAVQFDKIGSWRLKTAGVQLYTHPFKQQNPPEAALTVSSATESLYNPGDVGARPLLQIGTGGAVSIQLGGTSLSIPSAPAGLVIDCEAGAMLSGGSVWTGAWEGEFLYIAPGVNAVAISGGGSITLTPRWRWV